MNKQKKELNKTDKTLLYVNTVVLLNRQKINTILELILYLKRNSINSFLCFAGWDLKTLRNLEAFLFVNQIEYFYN